MTWDNDDDYYEEYCIDFARYHPIRENGVIVARKYPNGLIIEEAEEYDGHDSNGYRDCEGAET